MADRIRLSIDDATRLCLDVLRSSGLDEPQCAAVTRVIMAAEIDECRSHGLYRLLGCVRSVALGRVNKSARPKVVDLAPAIVRVDADRGFSSPAFDLGVEMLLEKASRQGLAALAVTNCHHFFALWPEVEPLARRGFAALALTPSHAWVAPAGGRRPVFGTNPVAFAWPRADDDPFVFDFATSASARGDIELHRRAGTEIPAGVAIDPVGRPTRDAAAALAGTMLTFGGYKGSALSAMVELLGGALVGDLISLESKAHDGGADAVPLHGELVVAFDPAVFLGAELGRNLDRAELLFDAIISQGARLPSRRRYEARRRSLERGVEIPRDLHRDLLRLLPETAK